MDKVLVVDDDIDLQSALSALLNHEGYEVIVAGTGKEALKTIRADSPDLVLLDVRLPKMNGIGVLEEIRKIDKQLIVIMLTGYGEIQDAVRAIKLGASDYITKPFDERELVATIKNALLNRPLKRKFKPLSKREKEMLHWIKHGKSSWEISVILDISVSTVNFHVTNMMRKLEAVTRTQAIARAIELGIIDSE